ncbi:hypothetical protein LOZ58_003002 [Ophidiomyces ophidiicola]|nr:hypothetical protein LOZ65_003373 [Ophidiomyces ophidiicola]KAI1961925.1 hypothetical protein LOZ58_003002 [Ophidiomyces ophidiicola]
MQHIGDEASTPCIAFVLEKLKFHLAQHANHANPPPFILGLNGVQGAGKTYLANSLSKLSAPPHNIPTIAFSVDDIYLTHADQLRLAAANPENPLLQHRGQPSTHDIALGKQIFGSLKEGLPTKIPWYDKSAFDGQGDRGPEDKWKVVNDKVNTEAKIQLVIFEGWCLGFRTRPEDEVRAVWKEAVKQKEIGGYDGQLAYVKLEDVLAVNNALNDYDVFTDQFDAFIHLDAENTHYVYDWRQESERELLRKFGKGMTPDQVTRFIDGYYPSYELFTPALRNGVFRPRQTDPSQLTEDSAASWRGKQLRLVLDKQRKVSEIIKI